jgi:hypothetical protein
MSDEVWKVGSPRVRGFGGFSSYPSKPIWPSTLTRTTL